MDFEKIKEFILEKKLYFIIGMVIIGIFFWMKKDNDGQVDNSNVFNEQSEQSSSFTSNSSSASSVQSTANSSSQQSKTVTCDISGAVKHQGVYTLKNGARLQELIEAAGGVKNNAQLKAVNRAVLLKDQDKIHIPYKGEKVDTATTVTQNSASNAAETTSGSADSNSGEKVNLNTANAQELQKLNGIGEKKAEQIVAYREQNGEFKKIEDLEQVSGIGEKTFAALKDQLTI